MKEFRLPQRLTLLLEQGIWPGSDGPSMTDQQSRPLVTAERVRGFAADETLICFASPPFQTIAGERALGGAGDFWERFGALDQIDPQRSLILGDFGMGSDSPIALAYDRNEFDPPVLRLRWGRPDEGNAWVQGANNFDEFADMLFAATG